MEKMRLAVIGDPVAHSLSPVMHNTFLKRHGIDGEMEAVQVKRGEVQAFVESIPARAIRGFNVTMPHKEAVLSFCDTLDPLAALCRSVNCVAVAQDGSLHGYNTDAEGLERAVESAGYSYDAQRILILGAGAVVKPLAYYMARKASRISVCNRTLSAAEEVKRFLEEHTDCVCKADAFTEDVLAAKAADCSMLINATPLGMEGVGQQFSSFAFLKALPEGVPVIDLIYRPEQTRLLQEAHALAHPVINGLPMLLYQGAISFSRFTGTEPTPDDCRAAAEAMGFMLP